LPGGCSSPLGSSSKTQQLGWSDTRRLAAQSSPPGGSSRELRKQAKWDESLGGSSSSARRFLENFQKPKICELIQ